MRTLDLLRERGLPPPRLRPYCPGQRCRECNGSTWHIGHDTAECANEECSLALPRDPGFRYEIDRSAK